MSVDIKTLIGKLNPVCRRAMETAAELAVSRTHYAVEVEHLLLRLLDVPSNDFDHILRYYEIDAAGVARQLTDAIDGFKRGNGRTPALSPQITQLLEEAWVVASLTYDWGQVRSAALILAAMQHEMLRPILVQSAPLLLGLSVERLRADLPELVRESTESGTPGPGPAAAKTGAGAPPSRKAEPNQPAAGRFQALEDYTIDLTAQARTGGLDPVTGRDAEVRQLIDILMRRRQNNPILTGEAGVGKTAVVEGFAARVAAGDVPPPLREVSVRMLDLGLLQAGAGIKGEFENRLKSVISEVKAAVHPVILFIDEAHTLIGAGGQAGHGDAANLLKPALARGELRTIAATTWAEYKRYIEKDPALARRFQVVKVEEPGEEVAIAMLRGLAPHLEKHHGVRILDEGVRDAVRLGRRYIMGRQLPDVAVSVLDTACARVAVSREGTPEDVEAARQKVRLIGEEIALLEREAVSGRAHGERLEELRDDLARSEEETARLESRWRQESETVTAIDALEAELASLSGPGGDAKALAFKRSELEARRLELDEIQGEMPMIPVCVDGRVVARVVSGWTGIPVGKMMTDEIATVLGLRQAMERRIIGQPQALDAVARRIRTARAGLDEPGKPTAVFLLAGPSGVGKTETAATISDLIYGGERTMITINMSEYQEAYTVSGLRGSPPGYVGHGKGGVLTEAVRRNPYSVVLLDEVEKAHTDVIELFYQVFDKGVMEDGEGVPVSFKNTIILLTTNVGTETIMAACRGRRPEQDELIEAIRPELVRHFKPAFLGRLVVVAYYPLTDSQIGDIVRLKLGRLQDRFWDHHRAELTYDEGLVKAIAARCTETDSGARAIDNILSHGLLPDLSAEILGRMADEQGFSSVHVGLGEEGAGRAGFTFTFKGEGPSSPTARAPWRRPVAASGTRPS